MNPPQSFAPPPINTSTMSPRRRQHDHQPPALSTTLSAIHRFGSHLAGHTPQSATTLSSPFNPANFTASPVAASPHPNARTPSGTYNPQQWGASPVAGARYMPHQSLNAAAGRTSGARGDMAEGDPPPPPYSPRRPQPGSSGPAAAEDLVSPMTVSSTTNSSRYNTPVSAATTISPLGGSSGYQAVSPQQMPQSSPHNATQGPYAATPPLPPPPPSSSHHRVRSSSTTGFDHPLQSGSHHDYAIVGERSQRISPDAAYIPSEASIGGSSVGSSAGSQSTSNPVRPPASRRAASTGGIGIAQPSSDSSSSSPHPREWRPGMPLPPPPPGPPPPSSRSQSMDPTSRNAAAPAFPTSQATRRPTAGSGSRLPPVPPTPSDWVDEEQQLSSAQSHPDSHARQLPHDTAESSTSATGPQDLHIHSEGPGLVRSSAVRDRSAKGIRERRSESRSGKGRMSEPYTAVEASNNPWAEELDDISSSGGQVKPADIVIPVDSGSMVRRRRTVTKSTPRSARSLGLGDTTLGSANSINSSAAPDSSSTRYFTPRPGSARQVMSPESFESTSTYSAGIVNARDSPYAIPPKSLPTPPPQGHLLDLSQSQQAANGRPLSHILHTPNADTTAMQPPLMPLRPPSQSSARSSVELARALTPGDSFAQAAIERHNNFAKREAAATSDQERVQIFAEFIVNESRLRRDKYADAIDAMGSEILELTRDLFRPTAARSAQNTTTTTTTTTTASPVEARSLGASPSSAGSEWSSHRGSLNSAMHESFTPAESPKARPDSIWAGTYMPSLSPIPSMSVSEVPDELSSRGRPSSRWWEASQEGSIYGGGTRGLERSKRESKYMGLPLRDWELESSSGNSTTAAAGPSTTQTVEYPPEKAGWHDESTPQTSDPKKLDVSRLVTLPPPYPRHYPAVNNNHPDLTSLRTVVRGLNDLSHISETREAFALECQELAGSDRKRRSQVRENIRRQIEADTISYAEAARLEEAEEKASREKPKREFEKFQADVMTPLHSILSERITLATTSIDELKSQLLGVVEQANPMEEGDEKPELLEKLTLLKWLFEAREQLHREVYDLLTERNTRYKNMVVAPYDDPDKIKEVEAFFARDGAERRTTFEKEALQRCETFMDVVEENVTKGVEIQLSAFWDIAPSLMEVVARINVSRGVQTDGERDYAFSQQYLWEVLGHAEKSAYQFIEGQVNLLCLLHEVKSGLAKQKLRVLLGSDDDRGAQVAATAEAEEEDRLTRDLKEKVNTVEKQWDEAMGKGIEEVKERVKVWLGKHGGWEGMEEDD